MIKSLDEFLPWAATLCDERSVTSLPASLRWPHGEPLCAQSSCRKIHLFLPPCCSSPGWVRGLGGGWMFTGIKHVWMLDGGNLEAKVHAFGSSRCGAAETNPTRIHEDADSIPGLAWGLGIWPCCGCAVGWQWQLPFDPWEHSYAADAALKKKKKAKVDAFAPQHSDGG